MGSTLQRSLFPSQFKALSMQQVSQILVPHTVLCDLEFMIRLPTLLQLNLDLKADFGGVTL